MPPKNARPQPGGGRLYVWRNAAGQTETFPSVTTILGAVIAKPAIPRWAARSCAEWAADNLGYLYSVERNQGRDAVVELVRQVPWTQRDAAADRGTLVHAIAEAITLGQEPTVPEAVEPYVKAWRAWVADFEPRHLMAEATVYSRVPCYAGTLDGICEIDGLGTVLYDIKTGKDVYAEAGLQLYAYGNAEFVGLPDGTEAPLPAVDAHYVLRLSPEGYDFVPMAADLRATWSAVLSLWSWAERPDLIGAAVGPGRALAL